jgi:predicted transcriptional regulator
MEIYNMSMTAKLLTSLQSGETLTARQITSRFGLRNPREAIRQLRNEGYCVYSNPAVLHDGRKAVKYRIGTPSRAMVAAAATFKGADLFV